MPSDLPTSYLVTGALGCIGASVVAALLDDGCRVVAFDASDDDQRLRLLVPGGEAPGLTRVTGDITDVDRIDDVFRVHGVEAVIHLAALQVPAVAAHPVLGARVNVVGTAVVLDAIARHGLSAPLAYASSIAAYDGQGTSDEVTGHPTGHAATLYGVYKRANEGAAHVYFHDHGVASIGLRPYVVYGPGRDTGMTADPTFAMRAAALGEGFHIRFGGRSQLQYVADVARAFVNATRSPFRGAAVCDLGGRAHTMPEIVAAIEHACPDAVGRITYDDVQLPFPPHVESTAHEYLEVPPATDLADGVRMTIERFRGEPHGR